MLPGVRLLARLLLFVALLVLLLKCVTLHCMMPCSRHLPSLAVCHVLPDIPVHKGPCMTWCKHHVYAALLSGSTSLNLPLPANPCTTTPYYPVTATSRNPALPSLSTCSANHVIYPTLQLTFCQEFVAKLRVVSERRLSRCRLQAPSSSGSNIADDQSVRHAELYQQAEMYYAYDLMHKSLTCPFHVVFATTLFNAACYLLMHLPQVSTVLRL